MFAKYAPAPFLSVVTKDCISKGRDYYDAGPRYNTNYIQCTGLGTVSDSLTTLKKHVFESGKYSMEELLRAVADNFAGKEVMRQAILNRTPFFGNDDDYADESSFGWLSSFNYNFPVKCNVLKINLRTSVSLC